MKKFSSELVKGPFGKTERGGRAMRKRLLAGLFAAVLLVLTGCGGTGGSQDLMQGVKPFAVEKTVAATGPEAAAATDFGVRLLQKSLTEENALISPVSVLSALAMTANGARGETLAQMEKTLGLTVEAWNSYLGAYLKHLPQNKKNILHMANAIWFKDDEKFTVNPDFLRANATYYKAAAYKAPFDDSTLGDINDWVEKNTDGMIPQALEEIPAETVMYLVNALALDAEWDTIYKERQVGEGIFTCEDGTEQTVELMHSQEYRYLEDTLATGVMKYYKGGHYAFAALLPKEGVSVAEYAASLTGEGLHEMLCHPSQERVITAIPKFETEYGTELSAVLRELGMEDAFDMDKADFSGQGTYENQNIYIGRVIHKTRIAVDEKGTKAGAVTVVEEKATTESPSEPKQVILNRPFIYLIIDCQANLPLFLGTAMTME